MYVTLKIKKNINSFDEETNLFTSIERINGTSQKCFKNVRRDLRQIENLTLTSHSLSSNEQVSSMYPDVKTVT